MRGLAVRISARAILVVGWVVFLVYAFPGYMSYDSVWQLVQARGMEPINDWHPPLMALVWRCTESFVAGPFPMLVIQSVAFLLGAYFVFKRFMRPRVAAVVAGAALVMPQNLIVMAVIWKDAQMAGLLVGSVAALLAGTRRMRIVAVLFLFVATAYRYNAAAATLPIIFLLWDQRDDIGWLPRGVVATGIWLAVTFAAFFVSGQLAETKAHVWSTAAAPVDIVGTIHFANRLDEEQLLRDTDGVPWVFTDKIQIHAHTTYRPENSFLDVTQSPKALMRYISTDEERAAVARAWKNVVFAHPYAFLRHRFAVFKAQLAVEPKVWAGFVDGAWAEDALYYRFNHASVQLKLVRAMEWAVTTILFHVRIYFWLAIALIPLARRNRAALTLFASGVFYQLGLFVVAPAIDYRYSHWLVVSTILGVIVLVVSRIRGVERAAEPASATFVPDAP